MYYGYRCYTSYDKPLGWLYTFSCDTQYAWTNKDLHWCKRWKTERGAKKHFDSYYKRWQFKSKGGYLKIEVIPNIPEPKSAQSRHHKILDESGDDIAPQPQLVDDDKSPMSFRPKPEILQWLEEERWTYKDSEPEPDTVLINRKLEKLMKLEQQGF
jgi:hypothetical protein